LEEELAKVGPAWECLLGLIGKDALGLVCAFMSFPESGNHSKG
jgi:hypothetical protein